MDKKEFDAVVVGSGPNGLSAAILLQQAGLGVMLLEAEATIGGGLRSGQLTLPGFTHDLCSAIHPMAAHSPFFRTLPLEKFGLDYIYPPFAVAHPFDDGKAAILEPSISNTAQRLGIDQSSYRRLMGPLVEEWPEIEGAVLGPLRLPTALVAMARFGRKALLPAEKFAGNYFQGEQAKGLFAGMAAHGMLPFSKSASAAAGLVLMIQGHRKGWPMARGGSQQIADALLAYFLSIGGKCQTSFHVSSLAQLPGCHAIVFDLTPRQLLQIAGHRFSGLYRKQLEKYRYGMGVFKVDWALDAPIPFSQELCGKAGTLHLGNSFLEIAASERITADGRCPEKPFVLLAQQSLFDPLRAPAGKHTAWAYCHVPNGSSYDMKAAIEFQVERFAPGFKDRILAAHVTDPQALERYNPNYIGGDINGGVQDLGQLFTRPALRFSPYRTSAKGIYICSSSTPPGGGVHGMCGYHAARRVLKDIFKLSSLVR